MVDWYRKSVTRWVLTAALGVGAGIVFWQYALPPTPENAAGSAPESEKIPIAGPKAAGSGSEPAGVSGNPTALRYATALQQGAWNEVIDMTCWMQQRLMRVQLETGSSVAQQETRATLIKRIGDRRVEGNRLRREGIEDQYVFSADAKIEPVGLDTGRTNLEQPTRDRTWVRVTYPSRKTALRDDKGIPIRSIVAGVNVSKDNLVLKASVVGNLDIDRRSVSYDWETADNSRVE